MFRSIFLLLLLVLSLPLYAQKKKPLLEGTIVSLTVDKTDGTSETINSVQTPKGVYRILGKAPKAGTKIKIKKSMISDGVMALQNFSIMSGPQESLFRQVNQPEKLLGVRLKFRNGPEAECSDSVMNQRLFTAADSVVSYFTEMSRGKIVFSGNVHPELIEVEGTPTICDYHSWANQAEAILRNRIDLPSFTKIMYFAPTALCGFSGVAEYIGGKRSWLNGGSCGTPGVVNHEMGHNLGFAHATTPLNEYGDMSDVMGNNQAWIYTPSLNAPNKFKSGWLESEEIIHATSANAQYNLSPLSPPYSSAGQARMLIVSDPDLGYPIFVSYRNAFGFDSNLDAHFFSTLSIHRSSTQINSSSSLINNLPVGSSYLDSTGVQIENLSLSSKGALVKISKTCVPRALTVDFASRTEMGANQTRDVLVSLRNNDGNGCSSTTLQSSFVLPNGVTIELLPAGFTVAPQTSVNLTLKITTSLKEIPEEEIPYSFILTGHSLGPVENVGKIIIDDIPPATPQDLTASPRTACQGVDLSWSLPPEAVPSLEETGAVKYNIYRNGLLIASSESTYYFDNKAKRGYNTYYVQAEDGAGNVSEKSNSVVVFVKASTLCQ